MGTDCRPRSITTVRAIRYRACWPTITAKIVSIFKNVIPCSCRRYCFWQGLFWRLSKRKRKILHAYLLSYFPCFGHDLLHFAMLLLTQYAPKTRILSSTIDSPRFGTKSEIYYSSVTIHCYYSLSLFTCYYSWHCSLRNFAYLRGVVPYISSKFLVCLVQDFFPRESYHLWAFLWEISLLTTTSLHLYKACN